MKFHLYLSTLELHLGKRAWDEWWQVGSEMLVFSVNHNACILRNTDLLLSSRPMMCFLYLRHVEWF